MAEPDAAPDDLSSNPRPPATARDSGSGGQRSYPKGRLYTPQKSRASPIGENPRTSVAGRQRGAAPWTSGPATGTRTRSRLLSQAAKNPPLRKDLSNVASRQSADAIEGTGASAGSSLSQPNPADRAPVPHQDAIPGVPHPGSDGPATARIKARQSSAAAARAVYAAVPSGMGPYSGLVSSRHNRDRTARARPRTGFPAARSRSRGTGASSNGSSRSSSRSSGRAVTAGGSSRSTSMQRPRLIAESSMAGKVGPPQAAAGSGAGASPLVGELRSPAATDSGWKGYLARKARGESSEATAAGFLSGAGVAGAGGAAVGTARRHQRSTSTRQARGPSAHAAGSNEAYVSEDDAASAH